MTKFLKKEQINTSWYEIDAKNAVVGRLATTALVASISYHDDVTWSFFTNLVIVPGLILLLITKSI